ncbi:Uncharacterised protein [Mycobacterium tuberculosis]|nr:Uncharacterised protein [Mycobacterium tuberculosis]
MAAVGGVAGAVVGGAVRGLRLLPVGRLVGHPRAAVGRAAEVGRDRVERGRAGVAAERRAAGEPARGGHLLRAGAAALPADMTAGTAARTAAEAVEDGAVGAQRDRLGQLRLLDLRLLGRGLRVQRVGGEVGLGAAVLVAVVLPGELGLVEGDRRPVVVVLHLVRRLAARGGGRRGRGGGGGGERPAGDAAVRYGLGRAVVAAVVAVVVPVVVAGAVVVVAAHLLLRRDSPAAARLLRLVVHPVVVVAPRPAGPQAEGHEDDHQDHDHNEAEDHDVRSHATTQCLGPAGVAGADRGSVPIVASVRIVAGLRRRGSARFCPTAMTVVTPFAHIYPHTARTDRPTSPIRTPLSAPAPRGVRPDPVLPGSTVNAPARRRSSR